MFSIAVFKIMTAEIIRALFLDVGGVLMTNGWDRPLRKKTADFFHIEYEEMNERHSLVFDTYETGKMTLDSYLQEVIFYKKRDFTFEEIKKYIFDAAYPFNDMIHFIKEMKKTYNLKVGIISNEGRELAIDRIRRFDLGSFVDFFIVSSFVHFRKPDADIYKLALDVAQVPLNHVIYIDDRPLLVEVATKLGIRGICHLSLEKTAQALSQFFK